MEIYMFWDKWNSQCYDFIQELKKENMGRIVMLYIWKLDLVVPCIQSLLIPSTIYCHCEILLKWHESTKAYRFFFKQSTVTSGKQSKFSDIDFLFSNLAHFSISFKKWFIGIHYISWNVSLLQLYGISNIFSYVVTLLFSWCFWGRKVINFNKVKFTCLFPYFNFIISLAFQKNNAVTLFFLKMILASLSTLYFHVNFEISLLSM